MAAIYGDNRRYWDYIQKPDPESSREALGSCDQQGSARLDLRCLSLPYARLERDRFNTSRIDRDGRVGGTIVEMDQRDSLTAIGRVSGCT
jgi:hypothetical protein